MDTHHRDRRVHLPVLDLRPRRGSDWLHLQPVPRRRRAAPAPASNSLVGTEGFEPSLEAV